MFGPKPAVPPKPQVKPEVAPNTRTAPPSSDPFIRDRSSRPNSLSAVAQIPEADHVFYSVSQIAARWNVSEDKTRRVLEEYRGHNGFIDLGAPESLRKHKRRYSIVRIDRTLLLRIEADLTKKPRGREAHAN